MKKKLAFFLCLLCCVSWMIPVFAYDFPSAFWPMNEQYKAAVAAGRSRDIITYGNQIIALLSGEPKNNDTKNTLVLVYENVGDAYAALGQYEQAAEIYRAQYEFTAQFGDEFYDYVKTSDAKQELYQPKIELYTDDGGSPCYGAKNEKENGVLFGLCSDSPIRDEVGNESMILLYHELGSEPSSYQRGVFREAEQSGCAIEFALNCPRLTRDLQEIRSMESNLSALSDLFSDYSDVPVFLRFAAEFNIWDPYPQSEEFKSAFRYVSDYFKSRNRNVALVWSPNQTSNWQIDLNDYYPGDDAVDWVGASSYAQPYFQGNANTPEETEMVFRSGKNADPVLALNDLIRDYGNRKPIMISECGCSHCSENGSRTEDTTEFASEHLKRYFAYLPMVYPQIKLMAYFDHQEPDEKATDFRLSSSDRLKREFLSLTKGSRFIQDSYSGSTSFCYRKIGNGTTLQPVFTVSAYVHAYDSEIRSVSYEIDGTYVGQSEEIPFQTYLDASRYRGTHELRATAFLSDGGTVTTKSTVQISGDVRDRIGVTVSGSSVLFDQPPVLYQDRTMVPMRKIFEALGATVSWDEDTQTAKGTRGDRTVTITVGNRDLYVNHKKFTFDTPAIVLSDRLLVPVRAVAEGLGCDVDWDDGASLVLIEPKEFRWSEWEEDLPDEVDQDLYYVEEKTEYRYRYREKEYDSTRSENEAYSHHYIRTDESYGDWSDFSERYLSAGEDFEVRTKEEFEPYAYHYAHYCTGWNEDEDYRWKTSSEPFCSFCTYHDMGWYDSLLPDAPDGQGGGIVYNADGSKYRCSNECWRWYIVEKTGGPRTYYSGRNVYRTYYYWDWGDWSRWSSWQGEDPYDEFDVYDDDTDLDVERRTVFRYKEK